MWESDLKIPIKQLSLWDQNARFPEENFDKTEEELIQYVLSDDKFRIENLAKAIVADFDIPQVESLVVLKVDDRYVVMEGNRRLIVYKLLADPSLANDPKWQKFFTELATKIKINENFCLDVRLTDDINQAFRLLDRKHNKGNNEVGWGDVERIYFLVRWKKGTNKKNLKVQMTKRVKALDLPENIKSDVLGKGLVTTFWRIIEKPVTRAKLGYEVLEDGNLKIENQARFNKLLEVIVYNVWTKEAFDGRKINSRDLNKAQQIEIYINSITEEDADKVVVSLKEKETADLFGEAEITKSEPKSIVKKQTKLTSLPKSTSRQHLIPRDCVLRIHQPKINNIYIELKNSLNINITPNAVGVLFRVFLEISLDYYAERNGFKFSNRDEISKKITDVTSHMETNSLATNSDLKGIRKVIGSTSEILHIKNFHEYVHSHLIQPTPDSLKLKWDNLQSFFELLWKALEECK